MYKHFEARFPGREKQLEQLANITMGANSTDYSPQSIFVYGPPSTGKTTVVSEIFKENGGYVNCVECFTPRLLFEHAMDQLIHHKPGYENGYTSSRKINDVQQFVKCIRETFLKEEGEKMETRYLILDRAERLRDMPGTLLPALLRLSELTEVNICVIFISNIVFEKFRVKGGGIEPFLIRFPEYNREDTIKILQRDFRPSTIEINNINSNEEDAMPETVDLDVPFYTYFLEVIYDSLNHNCKDINELRYHAALLFPLYIKPIKEGIVGTTEKQRLFKYVQPYIKEAVEKLYLREISSAEWSQEIKKQLDSAQDLKDQEFSLSTSNKIGKAEFELPYYTKFLLIATYLASYNPPKFDVRYFAKVNEDRKKKKGGGTRKSGRVDKLGGKMRQQLLGPKVFPVERMLAIFYSIIDEQIDDTIDIQLQITSLTTLRLLVRATTIDKLDGAKYKSNVNFEFIKSVAKSVRFEIDKYLYDFC